MKKQSFLKRKPTTIGFSIVSLIAGLIFLNANITPTSNAIVETSTSLNSTLLSAIGFLLIIYSLILALYSLKKE